MEVKSTPTPPPFKVEWTNHYTMWTFSAAKRHLIHAFTLDLSGRGGLSALTRLPWGILISPWSMKQLQQFRCYSVCVPLWHFFLFLFTFPDCVYCQKRPKCQKCNLRMRLFARPLLLHRYILYILQPAGSSSDSGPTAQSQVHVMLQSN